ncbi:hypothetical protein L9F63_028376, partial [Diploptera punctata]
TTQEIYVTWNTFEETDSIVEYGIGGLVLTAAGTSKPFISIGADMQIQYIHKVKLPELIPDTKY